MDLRQLRHFVSVAAELHFGRAAERLHMTQPPLSQSIRALEEELGVPLFQRTKRSVKLTTVGARWLPHAQRVLDEAAALPVTAERLQRGEIGALRLAFVSTADYHILPELISRYKTRYPQMDVSLQEATSDWQIEALEADQIDAGLVIPPPEGAFPAALRYRPLLREPLAAAVPTAWLNSGKIKSGTRRLAFAAVKNEPLILFPRRSAPAFHDIITGFYARHGVAPRLGQEAIQMQTIVSLVSAGLGMALVPWSMRHLGRTGVQYLALQGQPPEIETGILWKNDTLPALRRFLEMAEKTARS